MVIIKLLVQQRQLAVYVAPPSGLMWQKSDVEILTRLGLELDLWASNTDCLTCLFSIYFRVVFLMCLTSIKTYVLLTKSSGRINFLPLPFTGWTEM